MAQLPCIVLVKRTSNSIDCTGAPLPWRSSYWRKEPKEPNSTSALCHQAGVGPPCRSPDHMNPPLVSLADPYRRGHWARNLIRALAICWAVDRAFAICKACSIAEGGWDCFSKERIHRGLTLRVVVPPFKHSFADYQSAISKFCSGYAVLPPRETQRRQMLLYRL